MRVAGVYDIHGNLPALEAVLAAIGREGVGRIVVGGDIVPGPLVRESLATLLELSIATEFIRGNGENDLLALGRGEEATRVPRPFREVLRWAASELSPAHLARIAAWPPTHALEIPDLGRVMFCHATPRDDNEIFTRLTPEDRLRPIFEATHSDLVICGHTHMQFDRLVGRVRVINAGSVGMPFGDPAACWVLLGPGGAELRRTEYDLSAAAARIRSTAYPGPFDVTRPPSQEQMLEMFEAAALR